MNNPDTKKWQKYSSFRWLGILQVEKIIWWREILLTTFFICCLIFGGLPPYVFHKPEDLLFFELFIKDVLLILVIAGVFLFIQLKKAKPQRMDEFKLLNNLPISQPRLSDFVKDGGAIILSTHVLEVIEKICDRYILLKSDTVRADLQASKFENVDLEQHVLELLRNDGEHFTGKRA
jgi:hypothetical protein